MRLDPLGVGLEGDHHTFTNFSGAHHKQGSFRRNLQLPRSPSSKSNKSWWMNVAWNAIWFGQSVDRVLLSQSQKFQQDWVEGLRVVSKMGCSNGGAQQDIRVEGWRRKKGAYIVFLAGRGFLPIGPRAHRPSQPRAHGVSQPRAHGVSSEFRGTP